MSTEMLIALLVVAIVVAAVVWVYSRRQRSEGLRERFGPEYDRAVDSYGDQRRAEAVLEARQERAQRIRLHPIHSENRERLLSAWRSAETRFVDDPAGAVLAADDLLGEVMTARGYPDADFEQRAGDLSATYPHLVGEYRTAHELVMRSRGGATSTEDLRKAMKNYQALFEGLVGDRASERREVA